MEQLLSRGANPSQPDSKGRTALHYAAAAGQPRYVEWMLSCGANVNAVDELERTALMEACLEDTDAQNYRYSFSDGARADRSHLPAPRGRRGC